jgi:hypothetical protein
MLKALGISVVLVTSLSAFGQSHSTSPIDELRMKSIISAFKHWSQVDPEQLLRESREVAPEEYGQLRQRIAEARALGIRPDVYAPVLIAHTKMVEKWQSISNQKALNQ